MRPTAKMPPHAIDAERSVLGGMMLDNRIIGDVLERVTADDFYREDHQEIFAAIVAAHSERKAADFITVSEWLKARGKLDGPNMSSSDGVTTFAYLGDLTNDALSAHNAVAYAEIVREQATLRQVISFSARAADLAYQPDGRAVAEILDEVERSVLAIRERGMRAQTGPVGMSHLVELAERGLEARMAAAGGITGLRSGIVDLDEKTTGFHPGDLVLIAARPSMGKTSLAQNIAECCALDQDKWALTFSMEMPGEQLALRTMSSRGRVPLQALRSGRMEPQHWDRVSANGLRLRQAKLMIDETPALSPSELRARARRVAARNPLGLIVVDYVQLMQIPGNKENRTNEVAEISRSLKALAKELRVPVIALSQLNRGVEARENKRPRMADLRESGGLEQDADLILFIYRDEVYHPDSSAVGTAEIIIGKQRNGPLGMVRTAFSGEYCRFDNLASDWLPLSEPSHDMRTVKRGNFTGRRSAGSTHAAHAAPND